MSLLAGMVVGGLLGAYWTRPGGWMGNLHGHYPTYSPSQYYYPSQYSYPAQYGYPVANYPTLPRPMGYYWYPQLY